MGVAPLHYYIYIQACVHGIHYDWACKNTKFKELLLWLVYDTILPFLSKLFDGCLRLLDCSHKGTAHDRYFYLERTGVDEQTYPRI